MSKSASDYDADDDTDDNTDADYQPSEVESFDEQEYDSDASVSSAMLSSSSGTIVLR